MPGSGQTPSEAAYAALPYRPCVGVVLRNPDGLIFAGQRIDNPGPAWQMPQGGIDPGEAPQTAALRELAEETGLAPHAVRVTAETPDWLRYDLPRELVGKLWKGRYRGQEQKWFLMDFDGPDSLIDIATEVPEFSRWQWMTPDDLVAAIVPFKRALYRSVFDALGDDLAAGPVRR
ncbi:RNA pyrophosphohydrolase [Oceanomicrobium pacificus]|uniref:RNA pyrophosphohydrolase n=1 Tax=Oceanomicrobium pacificus TaxID=2692916 RepID=UPI002E299D8A|nr:RNA pyrophosphohydrolase [Oceanomicrobium pacificus]